MSLQQVYNKLLMSKGTVLVSGASGYIASHVIKQLLSRYYHVIGTVRSVANKSKYQFLYNLPNAKEHLQLREANLLDPQSWDNALKGVQNVIHVASPIPPGVPKDENQLIKPAVQGTKNVIDACLKNKIKRLLFTASTLCVVVRSDGKVTNQSDWSDLNLLQHYSKSKYLAEKLFWQQAQKHKNQLDFVSILPSLVTGPAFTKHDNSSQAFVKQILNGGYPGIPYPYIGHICVDVRDVAIGHVNALEYPQAKGKRYIISGYDIQSNEVFQILRQKYGPLGYKIPTDPIDAEGIKKSGHGLSIRVLGFLGKKFQIDNSRSINQLGMKYRTAQQSIIQQAQRQIQLGIVQKK